ncbi:hypothetical protein U1Q18_014838 [Sarracenia purpurea var. burkii]
MHFTLKAQRVSVEVCEQKSDCSLSLLFALAAPHHSPSIIDYVVPSNSIAPIGDAEGLGLGAVEGDRAEDEESGPGGGRN